MFSNVGRNDECPCGSGKKYKKCCMNKTWRDVAETVSSFVHPNKEAIFNTFFAVSDDLKEYPNPGACHLISGVFYVLLSEQNINSVIRIGEVKRLDSFYFDHSWIEIDKAVFDVAIQLTYDEKKNPPVFAGIDLGNGKPSQLKYGVKSPSGMDSIATTILNQSFGKYMDGFPAYKNGAWEIVSRIATKRLDLEVKIPSLREKYFDDKRVY